jgi:hypothetical protein
MTVIHLLRMMAKTLQCMTAEECWKIIKI